MVKKIFEKLREFNSAFGVLEEVPHDTIQNAVLRYRLLNEEAKEYDSAVKEDNKVEILDALADMMYIVAGTILKHGSQKSTAFIEQDEEAYEGFLRMLKSLIPSNNYTEGMEVTILKQNLYGTIKPFNDSYISSFAAEDYETMNKMLTQIFSSIQYAAHAHGLYDVFMDAFEEVHASNMSKLGEDGKPIFREDGKILKGKNYFKPNLAQFIK
ncbi:NTP-PPase-like protein [Tenacibaculum phage Larrie]|nr:NTP-PPase-like protein [Tenacibaculum phage Larrie]